MSKISLIYLQDDSRPLYARSFEFPVLHKLNEARPKSGSSVYLRYAGGWFVFGLLCLLAALYAFCIAVAPVCIVHVGRVSIFRFFFHLLYLYDNITC